MDFGKAYQLIESKLVLWLKELIRLLPNIVIASIVLVLGIYLARIIRNFSSKIFHRFTQHEAISNLFSSVVYVVGILATLFVTLTVLHLDKAVLSILTGAGIAGVALAFAFQDIAANFFSGIFLSIRKPLRIGDLVKSQEIMGKVLSINMRDTFIETFDGQIVIVPNKDIFQNSLQNYTRSGKRRFELAVGVSYGDDLDKVKQ